MNSQISDFKSADFTQQIGPRADRGRRPRGVALLAVIVTLVILSSMLAAIGWQIMVTRRVIEHRGHELQATWLARSGIEHVAAQLLSRTNPDGPADIELKLIERSVLNVRITEEGTSGPSARVYRVSSEARFPNYSRAPAVRTETRRYRRVVDGGAVRLEALSLE
jgi:hypothetical protein